MYICSIILVLSSILTSHFTGTQRPVKCEVGLPDILSSDRIVKQKDVDSLLTSGNWGQERTTQSYWTVYSDRDQNITYCEPDISSAVCDTLFLNEKLQIAKIENDFALVYQEQNTPAIYPQINRPLWKGWVPMTYLLLWSCCPADTTGKYNQVLLGFNLDEFKNKTYELGRRFGNPVTKKEPSDIECNMKFYFIMKKAENGMVLLSSDYNLFGQSSKTLYGWVHPSSFVSLKHRIFVEPTWDVQSVEKLKGKVVNIYHEDGSKSAAFTIGRENGFTNNSMKYRIEPKLMRYPLLGDHPHNTNRYSVITFTKPNGYQSGEGLNYLEAFKGYIEKSDSTTGLSLWNHVMLLSSNELDELLSQLYSILDISETEDRKSSVEKIETLIRSRINISHDDFYNKDIQDIRSLVYGLPITYLPQGLTFAQILDEKRVPNNEFDMMISEFRTKIMKLDRIRISYDFSFIINNNWYWLPIEVLP